MAILTLLIPEERKSVLIGKKGEVKKTIEKRTNTNISINEEVLIKGESIDLIVAENVVQAIGRGFSPNKAFLLFDEDYQLDIISLDGETQKTVKRLMARVIGRGGYAKSEIERATGCFISVYGKSVSIIGEWDKVPVARKSVELLLEGKKHSTIYRYLKGG